MKKYERPGKWRVVRARVSVEDVAAELQRRHPDPWGNPSYADAKAEIEAGGITVARIRRPYAGAEQAPGLPPAPTRAE
ncbi:MAG TPA: hypothetical protein VES36_11590, partial [Candidatus Limnocylindrales bacterium]|nr:hypothetical protein [Candidatus Limnocylindrales bacterium]